MRPLTKKIGILTTILFLLAFYNATGQLNWSTVMDKTWTYGNEFALQSNLDASSSPNSFRGIAYSRLCNISSYYANGNGYGIIGNISSLSYLKRTQSTGTASAVGGSFSVSADNLSFYSNSNIDYHVNGVRTTISGTISSIPSNATVSAIYARDLINTSKTYAGYFEGKSYFSGNVGIGTTSPTAKLHVNGSMYVNGKISFYYSGSYYNGITNDGSGNMIFNVGPTAPILKLSSSTVSIGCDGSSGKLNVNGKIQAKEIEIKSGPCSDFVFEPLYKLMPLNELEDYLNENKHLPEIPSAQEFQEEGYSIGEMDDLLLRKIEELTLYIIDLKKEIEVLKQK